MPILTPPYRWPYKPPLGIGIDRDSPLAAGLVGLWAMQEGAGDRVVNLASPGFGDGQLLGSRSWADTTEGDAISLSGTTDYLDAGLDLSPTPARTVAALFIPTAIGGDRYLISNGYDGSATGFEFYVTNSGAIRFGSYTGTSYGVTSASTVAAGVPTFAVAEWADGMYHVWINGVLDASAAGNAPVAVPSRSVVVGAVHVGGGPADMNNYFAGPIVMASVSSLPVGRAIADAGPWGMFGAPAARRYFYAAPAAPPSGDFAPMIGSPFIQVA